MYAYSNNLRLHVTLNRSEISGLPLRANVSTGEHTMYVDRLLTLHFYTQYQLGTHPTHRTLSCCKKQPQREVWDCIVSFAFITQVEVITGVGGGDFSGGAPHAPHDARARDKRASHDVPMCSMGMCSSSGFFWNFSLAALTSLRLSRREGGHECLEGIVLDLPCLYDLSLGRPARLTTFALCCLSKPRYGGDTARGSR